MYFHDLWEYVQRKLASEGTTTVIHPADNQMPSGLNKGGETFPDQAYHYLKRTNEVDYINQLSISLE